MRDVKYPGKKEAMSVEDLAHYYIGQDKGATGCS